MTDTAEAGRLPHGPVISLLSGCCNSPPTLWLQGCCALCSPRAGFWVLSWGTIPSLWGWGQQHLARLVPWAVCHPEAQPLPCRRDPRG